MNQLLPINPQTQFQYGENVQPANAQPLQTVQQSQQSPGLLELLSQLGMGSLSREDMIRMERSGMDPMNPADIKRYEEAMGSLSGRIGNLGDRIMNVPNRIVKAGDKGKEAITGLFDMFGGK